MMDKSSPATTHLDSGVDPDQEEASLQNLFALFQKTWKREGEGAVCLDFGFFANVIQIGNTGIAFTTDGVGSKVLIAQMMEKYDTIGIDCVAMNVNDLLCVGAKPIAMVDYIAVQEVDPKYFQEICLGLYHGAIEADISIPGGEIAQLKDVIKAHKDRPGRGFDLAGAAIGSVAPDKLILGKDLQEGDVIIGLESNGIHSNGLTLARSVFFERNNFSVETTLPTLDHSLGEELLKPTYIYTRVVRGILDHGIHAKALIHITGDGFLNLTRVSSDVSFLIDRLPSPPAIFSLIQNYGNIQEKDMFRMYNMGIGFCMVVPDHEAEKTMSLARTFQKQAYQIGHIVSDGRKEVRIPSKNLRGHGKHFFEI